MNNTSFYAGRWKKDPEDDLFELARQFRLNCYFMDSLVNELGSALSDNPGVRAAYQQLKEVTRDGRIKSRELLKSFSNGA